MKKYSYLIAAAMMLVMASCKQQNNTPVEAPKWFAKPELKNRPQWKITEAIDITSSMNIIASVNAVTDTTDLLAALCDDECIGLCKPVETKYGYRFYLCIYQPTDATRPITLAYYNQTDQSLCYWIDKLSYTQDAVLGMAGEPYELDTDQAQAGLLSASLTYTLPGIVPSSQDELALFCGERCRQLLSFDETEEVEVILKDEREEMYIRYFSGKEGKIYTSQTFALQAHEHQNVQIQWQ